LSRVLQRSFNAMARLAMRTGAKALKQALRPAKKAVKPKTIKTKVAPRRATAVQPRLKKPATQAKTLAHDKAPQWTTGVAVGPSGARRYRLYTPPGVRRGEHLPLVVMLHGCAQDAQALASSTKMNRLAQAERFLALYPEQDRLANLQHCWNWYDTRSGRAQREADSIVYAVNHICLTQPVDRQRIALAGLSAGASLAALLAVRHPGLFKAVVMHSGVAPGMASSTAGALSAMRGHRAAVPLAPLAAGQHLPALLVIQGSADPIVAPGNAAQAVQLWANCESARASQPRTVQRGKRYPSTVTDHHHRGRLVATLCLVNGLGHAWSGGAAGLPYSDPNGPDASRMAWSFMQKQFAAGAH
jgi:poly(hydroxyalkanoate) depolymerase family esterase